MQTLFDFLNANPWIYAVLAAGLAVWIAALLVIFGSPKFLRKWLWVLLSLVSFTFSWQVDDNVALSIGLPLGALYVLWFWRFGKSPTDEEIAERGPKPAGDGPRGKGWQILSLRLAYLMAITAVITVGIWTLSDSSVDLIFAQGGITVADLPTDFRMMLDLVRYFTAGFMILLCGMFVLLFLRPYGWGKILMLFCTFSWLSFSGVQVLVTGTLDARALPVLIAGAGMLLAILLHQIADPRFTGTYLRQS
ncbi:MULTISPECIES: hypothetical protein [Asticcacaulis]|uniref:hypothetical protein n=1 Tax=Asticcacaulis TaxID=76890 RepID=UPI001AE6175C|nr:MULTISPECIES: hypothetical protein [Asticcacaulis]MBP2159664.1 hypothetical protein [Asticcacaulis solisilvae]MDR6800509.1 hypothetical protein [Asticcacaulis sp. BE141]